MSEHGHLTSIGYMSLRKKMRHLAFQILMNIFILHNQVKTMDAQNHERRDMQSRDYTWHPDLNPPLCFSFFVFIVEQEYFTDARVRYNHVHIWMATCSIFAIFLTNQTV